ncbi:MAG TPA: aminotransferase class III-fold pyridoxal phosphate-dependent enzyme, partial [Candidatus Thermoplasmatota archaeon]|nr:aminotransferase class III-fold pyridoxal phosphate-dependent enzyme [Candidatus Thermoplasmatota archaeon]
MKLDLKAAQTNAAWQERWTKSSLGNYAPAPVAFARGQGSYLWDVEGKKYLDFAAGVAVCSTGHAHPKVAEAIAAQAKALLHTSNLYLVPNQIRLAEELLALSGLHRAFFCNSGTEAIEAAMKLARYWGHQNGGRTDYVATSHSFHGRTMGALTLTRNPKYQQGYEPLLPGVHEVPFDDLEAMKAAVTRKTCAVIVEPIQGEGGVNVPRDDYLRGLRDQCTDKNVLLVLDEVQTGIGRTGDWFAYQRAKIQPDVLALAKGLGSGFPIGALLCSEKAN